MEGSHEYTRSLVERRALFSTVPDGQLTAKNLSLEVGEVSFVYRRFGNAANGRPSRW